MKSTGVNPSSSASVLPSSLPSTTSVFDTNYSNNNISNSNSTNNTYKNVSFN